MKTYKKAQLKLIGDLDTLTMGSGNGISSDFYDANNSGQIDSGDVFINFNETPNLIPFVSGDPRNV